MADILRNPSVGGNLGSALGAGLSALAHQKIGEIQNRNLQAFQQQQTAQGLQSLGISPQEALGLSFLSPDILKSVISQRLQAPSQEAFAQGIAALLGGGEQQLQPAGDAFAAIDGGGQPAQQEKPVRDIFQYGAPQSQPEAIAVAQPSKKPILPEGARLTEKQASTLGKLALQKQANEQRELGKLRREEFKENKQLQKESREYLRDLQTKDEVAKFSDTRLDKMENLVKKGGLPISGFYNLLKNLEEHVSPTTGALVGGGLGGYFGVPAGPLGSAAAGATGAAVGSAIGGLISPITGLLRSGQKFISPNTEEFEKLSADFVKDAKGIFGARITDADLKAFFQTVPTLSNTDAGKLVIINNLRAFNEAAHIKNQAAQKIIKENGGIVPPDLRTLVEERTSKQLDKWSKEFSEV